MVRSSVGVSRNPRAQVLSAAICRTLAYADIFDYPLTAPELQRYLHGEQASLVEVRALVEDGLPGVDVCDGFYLLRGRHASVLERRRRNTSSEQAMRRARAYALLLKHLPFVRMIGLTGSLAMANASEGQDIDLMVVTVPGRVWLCRAAVIVVVHLARLAGDTLCPNYVVAEHALTLNDHSEYEAHELAQMLPLYGRAVYLRLWACNERALAHLPNARPRTMADDRLLPGGRLLKRAAERLLSGRLGNWLEAWEQRCKVAQLRRQQTTQSAEIVLSADQCKGHFGQYRARVLDAYRMRLETLQRFEHATTRRGDERGAYAPDLSVVDSNS